MGPWTNWRMVAPMIIKNTETDEILELKELKPLSLWPTYQNQDNEEVSLTPFPNIQGYEVIE